MLTSLFESRNQESIVLTFFCGPEKRNSLIGALIQSGILTSRELLVNSVTNGKHVQKT